jgi:predicted pyridoxine 5'-phosphate oxidase superfamily flavin-nucleotide-binding protein
MQIGQPFHEGELEAQRRAGASAAAAARNGKAIGDEIMPGALQFLEQQRVAAVASIDSGGDVWASLLFGEPGFVSAADRRQVEVDLAKMSLDDGDPLWSNLRTDPRIGMLLIEFATRRRLRINGRASWPRPTLLRLAVEEAYPNCPKYIRRRHIGHAAPSAHAMPRARDQTGTALLPDHRRWIASADTLFVGSAHATRGADVSHRGGESGFVSVLDDQTLRVPDYAGNGMFNTFGNLTIDPRAGLVFLDFDSGRTLQLVGRAEIRWDAREAGEGTGGTHRFWDFHIRHWREAIPASPIVWECPVAMPARPTI